MKKIFIKMNYVLAFLLSMFLFGCLSSVTFTDLSTSKKYSHWIGKNFKLETDCYIITPQDDVNDKIKEKYYALTPALRLGIKGMQYQYIGKYKNGAKILAAIPKGTLFKIIYIYRMESFNTSGYYVYIKLLNHPHTNILDAYIMPFSYFIKDDKPFLKEYALPIVE